MITERYRRQGLTPFDVTCTISPCRSKVSCQRARGWEMAKPKKSKRITLRVTPKVHKALEDLAGEYGIGLNDLLNLMICREVGPLAAEAKAIWSYWDKAHEESMEALLKKWQKKYDEADVKGKARHFAGEFCKYVVG